MKSGTGDERGRNYLGDDPAFAFIGMTLVATSGRPDAPIPFGILFRNYFPVIREDHGLARMTHLQHEGSGVLVESQISFCLAELTGLEPA